jgi:hypothetical protein
MTLIATNINKYGIIVTSDSNLSNDAGNSGFGQKVFPIHHLNSALAYSGSYSINGQDLNKWMNDFIDGSFFIHRSIEEFVLSLSQNLSREMNANELSSPSIIHVCGYQHMDGVSHVEHWHISNAYLNINNGLYENIQNEFHFANDFNSRLNQDHFELLKQFEVDSTFHQFYINGFPPGRMGTFLIKNVLDAAFREIWNSKSGKFRKPQNLFETSVILEMYFDIISTLFKLSDYNALYIGGKIQVHLLHRPQNLNLTNFV